MQPCRFVFICTTSNNCHFEEEDVFSIASQPLGFIIEICVRVGGQLHDAHLEYEPLRRLGGNVVQYILDCCNDFLSG